MVSAETLVSARGRKSALFILYGSARAARKIMPQNEDIFALLAQADAHYHALEQLLPRLRFAHPYYHVKADFLLQDVRLHRVILHVLGENFSARKPRRLRRKKTAAK